MLAIIGGTGLNALPGLDGEGIDQVATDYSDQPVAVTTGEMAGHRIWFLPRHGAGHTVPPHRINYRANIQALQRLGATGVIAVNAVGGIHEAMGPGEIAIPDQIIDYSWGRAHTFHDGGEEGARHIDFTEPYDREMRRRLIDAAAQCDVRVWPQGVYACTQGPRLETAAEVRLLKRDGCDMIGMTGMPEAALAREAGLPYAALALSVNWGAGLTDEEITMDAIRTVLNEGMVRIYRVLESVVASG